MRKKPRFLSVPRPYAARAIVVWPPPPSAGSPLRAASVQRWRGWPTDERGFNQPQVTLAAAQLQRCARGHWQHGTSDGGVRARGCCSAVTVLQHRAAAAATLEGRWRVSPLYLYSHLLAGAMSLPLLLGMSLVRFRAII